jgi:hypothetical protein
MDTGILELFFSGRTEAIAVPGLLVVCPGHGQRAQPQDLWQAIGTEAHRSCRKSQIPQHPPPPQLETTPPNDTLVSVRQHRAVAKLLYMKQRLRKVHGNGQ